MLNIPKDETKKMKNPLESNFHLEHTTNLRSIERRWDWCNAYIPKEQSLLDTYSNIINVIESNSHCPEMECVLIGIPLQNSDRNPHYDLGHVVNRFFKEKHTTENATNGMNHFIDIGMVHFVPFWTTEMSYLIYIYQTICEIGTHDQIDCDVEHVSFTLIMPSPLPFGFNVAIPSLVSNGIRVVVVDRTDSAITVPQYDVRFVKEDFYKYNSGVEFQPWYTRQIPKLHWDDESRIIRDLEVVDNPYDHRKSLRYCNVFYVDTKKYDKANQSYYPSKELAEVLLYKIQEWEIEEYPDLESLQSSKLYYIGNRNSSAVERLENVGFSDYVNFAICEENTMKGFKEALKEVGLIKQRSDFSKNSEAAYVFVETYLTRYQIEKVVARNLDDMVNRVEVIVIRRSPLKKGDK